VGVTANTTDPDVTDAITYSLDDDAAGRFAIDATTGVVTVSGAIDREAAGSYNITIRATSTDTSFTTLTLSINVNDVDEFDVTPVVDTDVAANTVNANAANGSVVGVTAFASDADATKNSVTYSLVDSAGGRFAIDASTGTVSVADGTLLNRVDSSYGITIRATSADGSTADALFTIMLNQIPVALSETFVTSQSEAITIAPAQLLANDIDLDGGILTVVIVSGTAHGTLTVRVDGTIIYSPDGDFSGTDSFQYSVFDGAEMSIPATVTIVVQPFALPPDGDDTVPSDDDSNEWEDTDEGTPLAAMGPTVLPQQISTLKVIHPATASTAIGQGTTITSLGDIADSTASVNTPEPLAIHSRLFSRFARGSSDFRFYLDTNILAEFQSITTSALTMASPVDTLDNTDRVLGIQELVIGSAAIVTTSLTIGYVVWLIRGGALAMSFISSLPSWTSFDPLPIVESFEDAETIQDDDESLQTFVSTTVT
jgi:hypothetical protein